MRRRSFLFLQGMTTPFFGRLADRLLADGHGVSRVNFTCGDGAYWGRRPAQSFRAALDTLPEYLQLAYTNCGATDQILFGDRRPVHRIAIDLATRVGVRTHVFEEGYVRPFWVTLERGGVNARSRLPREPQWFREAARSLPVRKHVVRFASPLGVRAMQDIVYHLASAANPVLYPGYRTHVPYNAFTEYAGYALRFPTLPFHRRVDERLIKELVERRT